MVDIFISYAREDKARAQILAEALERHNFSVWWDKKIPPGKTWEEFIGGALDSAKSVIVLWSEVSVKSNWVKEEADRAARRGVLIPVFIDKIQPPLGFGRIEAADLINWQGESSNPDFMELISAVSDTIGRPFNTGEDKAIVSSSKDEKSTSDVITEPPIVKQLGAESLNVKVSPSRQRKKWRNRILIGLSLLIVGTVVLTKLFTNSPKIRDESSYKFNDFKRDASPDKFDGVQHIRDESSYEFDGFKLGSLYASKVMSRSPYGNPCYVAPIDNESRRVMIYGTRGCPGRSFPEHTMVIFFLPYVEGRSGEDQPIRAFAWMGGNYFATRSNFPLRIGEPVDRATDVLGVPRRRFALPGGLDVQKHPGRVYSIIHDDKLVGFVVGTMPGDPDNDQWRGIFPRLYFDHTFDRRNEGVLE